jgi:hypothetical protein
MNSSYSLERYAAERSDDSRRTSLNLALMPLRPSAAGKIGSATLHYGLLLALSVALLLGLLIG